MLQAGKFEFPADQQQFLERARRLEWITLGFLASSIVLIYLVMGNSQAMRAALLETTMALVPPTTFLVASQFDSLQSNSRFPYGYHRFVSAGFLVGAVALTVVGTYLVVQATTTLISGHHPTVGPMKLFGTLVWQGWIMIAVLGYAAVGSTILGYKKVPLARELNDKPLHTDAEMLQADWMTNLAAMGGIVGIGFGFWWADAVAALVIGADVLADGVTHTRWAFSDLMDASPTRADRESADPNIRKIKDKLATVDWIDDADIRMRQEGRLIYGEAYVVPREVTADLLDRLDEVRCAIETIDWRIHEFAVVPVRNIPDHLRGDDPRLEDEEGTAPQS